ncbi:MAG TPA: hypothetical protein PKG73_00945, partial [bacterium]|nr:hypothetical protein [bacterium]
LSEYIKTWYNFIIGAIGILATVMIMYGGLKWLTSRGNSAVISNAKEKIFSALIGLVLVFLSYTILYLVNPNLVNIKPLDISTIEPKEIQLNYSYTDPTTNDNVRITDIGLDLAESDGGTIRPGETAADAIARNARSAIGVSTSRVPGTDEGRLACAYSVNEIVRNALGQPINTSLGTANVYNTLDQDNDYILTENAHQNLGDNYSNLQPGDIIISPTGDDRLSRENGHVGIYIGDGEIVSNASTQATIAAPYNVQQWIERYGFFDTFRHQ